METQCLVYENTTGYLKNHCTKHRHVCTHFEFDAYAKLISKNDTVYYNFGFSLKNVCKNEGIGWTRLPHGEWFFSYLIFPDFLLQRSSVFTLPWLSKACPWIHLPNDFLFGELSSWWRTTWLYPFWVTTTLHSIPSSPGLPAIEDLSSSPLVPLGTGGLLDDSLGGFEAFLERSSDTDGDKIVGPK